MNVLTTNISRIPVSKSEDNSVLIIHTDAPITCQVILELLKLVSWTFQIIETSSSVENIEFAHNHLP
jgi:hypothetical protein